MSFAFDMSWEELLWLVEGHEVHICDEDLRRDAEALVAYCDALDIDVVNVTPTYATHLIDSGLLDDGVGDTTARRWSCSAVKPFRIRCGTGCATHRGNRGLQPLRSDGIHDQHARWRNVRQ